MRSTRNKKDNKAGSQAASKSPAPIFKIASRPAPVPLPVISKEILATSEDKELAATASLTPSTIKPPSKPTNVRQKLLHHALDLINEPIEKSGLITRTLDFNGIGNLMDLLNLTHKELDEPKFFGLDPVLNRNKTYKLMTTQVDLLKIIKAYNVFNVRTKPLSAHGIGQM